MSKENKANKVKWTLIGDALPENEDIAYIVTVPSHDGGTRVDLAYFTKNLGKRIWELDHRYDGVPGFYVPETSWGDMHIDDVIAWCEIEPYQGQ